MDEVVFLNFPAYLFYLIYLLLTGNWGAGLDLWGEAMAWWERFKILSTILSLLLLTGIVYTRIRIWQVAEDEEVAFSTIVEEEVRPTADARWERVLALVASENPNDWRQAVIEADILLDLVLQDRGYPGDSIGERLKHASGLRSIQNAWEAHKVRNAVAHGGADFILTQRDAREAVQNFHAALAELGAL